MIITMFVVGVVQVPAYEVVDMVVVGDGFMPTTRPVHVVRFMLRAVMRGAAGGVLGG